MTLFHTGYVAMIGRPNVGKSTLLNQLVGEKISIMSSKPQTTRFQIVGIKTLQQAQIIYIDTPGIHQQEKRAMSRYLNRLAHTAILDADVILWMITTKRWYREDELVLNQLKGISKPVILVINKVDQLPDKALLLPYMDNLNKKFPFIHIIPISALRRDNLSALETAIISLLPEGQPIFSAEERTDKRIQFWIAEIIREKLIHNTAKELPYATSVEIQQIQDKDNIIDINAVIWVERVGQRMIIIGKKGAKLKKIGTMARREIEKKLGKKVFLRLWVKVKARWTEDERALKGLGYEC